MTSLYEISQIKLITNGYRLTIYLQRMAIITANYLVQFRVNEDEKNQAIEILSRLGMDLTSYLRLSINRLNLANGLPFSMQLVKPTENKGIQAMKRASKIAEEFDISNMRLDEINKEIDAARSQNA